MQRSLATIVTWLAIGAATNAAERPSLQALLPRETIGYLRVANYDDLLARLQRTAPGRLSRDPQLVAFAESFVESVLDYEFPASALARERGEANGIATAWRDSISAMCGEIVVAATARQGDEPAWIVMIDGGPSADLVRKLMEGELRLAMVRGELQTERLLAADLRVVRSRTTGQPLQALLVRDEVYVLCEDPEVLRHIARAWDGGTETLANNLRHQKWRSGREGRSAEVEFYLDLAALLPAARQPEPTVSPAPRGPRQNAGHDPVGGYPAIGGALEVSRGSYDLLLELEILLDQPRAGLAELIALGSEPLEAEPWVPGDVFHYSTVKWDVLRTLHHLEQLREQTGDDLSVARWLNSEAGLDHAKIEELGRLLTGRLSHADWFLQAASQNRRAQISALHVRSGPEFQPVLEAFLSSQGERVSHATYQNQLYFQIANGTSSSGKPLPPTCVCLLANCLLIANQPAALEAAIDGARGKSARLSDELDFKLVASKARRLAGDKSPGAIQFFRPAEALRHYHDLATSELGRELLKAQANENVLCRALLATFDKQPLPEFQLIDRYFAAAGAMAVDEGEAVQYTLFVLRRN